MKNKKSAPMLIRKPQGYWQYSPLPSESELQKYYAEKYFQQGLGSYAQEYTNEELQYFKLKAELILKQVARLKNIRKMETFLDVGCGEGWVLDRMHQEGLIVKGIDFSNFGIMKFNSYLKDFFTQGNIFKLLELEKKKKQKYNIISLINVIEHVIDPEKVIKLLKQLLSIDGILIIVAPNDFSALHKHLLKEKYIKEKFWLAYPDHISYFNKKSMEKFLNGNGFNVDAVVADNPIDCNLMNAHINYIKDKSKGKETHYARVRVDNFLGNINKDKLLDMYTILGSMGVGRDLNYYCSLKQ